MSRIAKVPVSIPFGVKVNLTDQEITVKGGNGELTRVINDAVMIEQKGNSLVFHARIRAAAARAQAGTARALVDNMIVGVTQGFHKKLILKGVGYRVVLKDNVVVLTLGFSHSIQHALPCGIKVNCPNQTEIIIMGCDKQLVGQVAADIRSYREPEPYKGKGIRYLDEDVRTKEAKKK
ncbi:50S ribosomal protein L6 [Candidatus Photodesmus blepharus]|uniref:Large ribosomal subunit protein uL6 n=1 Tax=Candidatus Photodesmus blepharonis TaxID=1179155 RepID=A0A084CM61_9GAMM|nr:50S ribosomal protein L6 [Candidatus Photodesmus blepharus]KEY90890.1 50S ribosomal protein L6 [Candidatus Photodesmus blepharus]